MAPSQVPIPHPCLVAPCCILASTQCLKFGQELENTCAWESESWIFIHQRTLALENIGMVWEKTAFMIINPTNVRERRKTGYTHDSLQRVVTHILPRKKHLTPQFLFFFSNEAAGHFTAWNAFFHITSSQRGGDMWKKTFQLVWWDLAALLWVQGRTFEQY